MKRIALLAFLCLCIGVRADLIASDNADNDPYPLGWNPGDNGGFGFTGWTLLDSGVVGGMYTATAIDEGSYSWQIQGQYALGRGLASTRESGVFTLLARHELNSSAFSGFNLKTSTADPFAEDEILRFGMNPSDSTGIYISTDAGGDYIFLDCEWIDGNGDVLQYTITWTSSSFTVAVMNLSEAVGASYSGSLSGGPVAMLGVGIDGVNTNERLTFDAFEINPIPEPGACALALCGAVVLLCASRRGRVWHR